MEHTEPWQVYSENGQPVVGVSANRDEFKNNSKLIMGAAHVWVWRHGGYGLEILLQKRSSSKKTWPGFFDISAAGHIDEGESPIQTAARETLEEIGLSIDPDNLYYIFSLRTPLDSREIDTVYLYELKDKVEFRFDDGEVEKLEWKSLIDFKNMTMEPGQYNLVPQGDEYFSLVISSLNRFVDENH